MLPPGGGICERLTQDLLLHCLQGGVKPCTLRAGGGHRQRGPDTRKPKPKTRNPKLETRNPKPRTRDLKPETRNPNALLVQAEAQVNEGRFQAAERGLSLHPKPGPRTRDPKFETRKPKLLNSEVQNQKPPSTLNSEPETRNPKPQT